MSVCGRALAHTTSGPVLPILLRLQDLSKFVRLLPLLLPPTPLELPLATSLTFSYVFAAPVSPLAVDPFRPQIKRVSRRL